MKARIGEALNYASFFKMVKYNKGKHLGWYKNGKFSFSELCRIQSYLSVEFQPSMSVRSEHFQRCMKF